MTFTHAHIMGGTSGAVCMPSRAMLLTGRTLFSIEREGQRIPEEHTAMPEWFRHHGYITSHVGKWHQDRESHARCFSTGAKIFGFKKKQGWCEACNGHWHVPVHDFDPRGSYDPDGGYNEPEVIPYQLPFETTKENGRHSAEVFTDSAIEFITDHNTSADAESPFFLYLAHIAPHDPRQYPSRLRERYTAGTVSLPDNFLMRHPFDNGDLYIRDELLECYPRRPESVRQHIADYFAIITHVDEQIGRILDTLEATGQDKNTIIVFSGDNGLAVGQHGLMGKQSLYDHSVRVPLMISGPGIPAGGKTGSFCYLLDIFPTLCELCGLDVPETVEGKSLAPVISEPDTNLREVLHFAYKGFQRAVKRDRHKLIEYSVNGERNTQLFDLQEDPLEMENLAHDPAHSDTVENLRTDLETWRIELNDDREDHGKQFWNTYDRT